MQEIGIGLLGFGTVGTGVVAGLRENSDVMAERLGIRPVLRMIADLDIEKDRGIKVDPGLLTRDAEAVIRSGDIDLIVELIGGTGAARRLVLMALEAGKPVVTANKALLAEHGAEIFALAARKNVDIYYGASVGGGIPIIRMLREGLIANRIESIYGILNGTCNYILTRMESERLPFDKALMEAQEQGYAEANPALDIDGIDTAHKAVILASLAYGFNVPMAGVHIEGIRNLSEIDIEYAGGLGYRIKLLAVIKGGDGAVQVRVHPALVPQSHMLASVSGVFNAAMVRGDLAGDTLYYGRGAGRNPTASTVMADIADVVRNLVSASPHRVPAMALSRSDARVMPIGDIRTRYYLRLSLVDKPGVLARITAILGAHDISIASVLQTEIGQGEHVPVVIVSHGAREREMDAALTEIDALSVVGGKTVRLRIED